MRTDIDWDQKDQFGYINRDRVSEGYAPLDKSGKPIQLHHIGQHADSPLAELTFKEHRTGGNTAAGIVCTTGKRTTGYFTRRKKKIALVSQDNCVLFQI